MENEFNKYSDGVINSYDELVNQLESLKEEAKIMMVQGEEIFKRDFHALKIAIQMVKDLMEGNNNGKKARARIGRIKRTR